jgi:hypothetical protein
MAPALFDQLQQSGSTQAIPRAAWPPERGVDDDQSWKGVPMNKLNVDKLAHALTQAPLELQGIKFDENREAAGRLARCLVEMIAVVVPDALLDDDCVQMVQSHLPRSERRPLDELDPLEDFDRLDDLDAAVCGSLLRGQLKSFARGEP